jgi:transcriptional regulator GlxA family with amidase domain
MTSRKPTKSPEHSRDARRRTSPRTSDRALTDTGVDTRRGPGDTSLDPALLRRLLRAKDRMDVASHEEWPVHRLARVSRVSEAHFARSFKDAFGVPPHRYLLTRRIERAKTLLRDTELAITEIAFQTGWQSLGTFGRTFRDITGESPGELRAREKAAMHALEQVPACFVSAAYRPDLTIAVSEKRRQEAVDSIPSDETQA